LVGIFLFYILPESVLRYIWVGEDIKIIIVAFIASFIFHQFWPIAHKMAEASRQTLKLYIISIITNVIHLICISIFLFYEKNSIALIFCIIGAEWLVASIFVARLYKYKSKNDVKVDNLRVIFAKYSKYCLPLAPYTIIGFFYSIGDKWMLQNWSGSVEQSYFGIGLRFSGIALLATSALLAIFWKEVAVLYKKGEFNLLEELFNKTILGLYIFTSIIVALILPWSSSIVEIFLGDEYSDGILTITILLIYPVHQCIGQITGSFLYAIEYTKLQSLIGCIFMITSLFSCYILLSPNNHLFGGVQLGSFGLAINVVVINFIFTNITLYYIYKNLNWEKKFSFQLIFLLFILLTSGAKYILSIYFESFYTELSLYIIIFSFLIIYTVVRFKNIIKIKLLYV